MTALRDLLLGMLSQRGSAKTCCPSEIARRWAEELGQPQQWRELMQAVREEAFELQRLGQIEVTQKGQPVWPPAIRGPIRLRWRGGPGA